MSVNSNTEHTNCGLGLSYGINEYTLNTLTEA